MRIVRDHLDYIEKSIDSVDEIIDSMAKQYEKTISLFCTIPGVDRTIAVTIISEIGTDIAQFGSSNIYAAGRV